MRPTGTWQENVNQVIGPAPIVNQRDTSYINHRANQSHNQNNTGLIQQQNQYREHHQSYMVFTTESVDRQSLHRRNMEVNAVVPAVPFFMDWSDQAINWNCTDHPGIMPNPGGDRKSVV